MTDMLVGKTRNRRLYLTSAGIELVRELLEKGNSYASINRTYFNIDKGTFRRMCQEAGLNKDNRRKYHLNEYYFDIIDTPEKAYWLGFLSADGYIEEDRKKINLQLQPCDIHHLEKFEKALNADYPIKTVTSVWSNGNTYEGKKVVLQSTNMVEKLKELGCHQHKSLDLKPPTDKQVPPNLIKYWILGYYDGDGGIASFRSPDMKKLRFKSYFTSTYEVIAFIKEYYQLGASIRLEHNCTQTYKIEITENPTIRMLNDLYDKNSIDFCLDRKYQKYIELTQDR